MESELYHKIGEIRFMHLILKTIKENWRKDDLYLGREGFL